MKKNVIVFAKEKYGLNEVLGYLRNNFSRVNLFKGNVGDVFPEAVYADKYDICVSYMSPWVIPRKLLSGVAEFSINFHPGPPEYRGIGCTNFAIYNNASEYGITAHLMIPEIDAGKIISVKYFPVSKNDSLVDLTNKCYQNIPEQFYEVFDHYLKYGKLPEADKKWSARIYTRKELNELCRITNDMPEAEIKKRVKATNFPNMPKAYVEILGYRFEYKE